MKDIRILKQLQSQLNNVNADIEALKSEIKIKRSELTTKHSIVAGLQKQIASLNADESELKVSEHAIVRYFERVKGYDISEIEKEILNNSVTKIINVLGSSGTYPNSEGYSVVMKNSTVVTIT